jgi:hypothetical protein
MQGETCLSLIEMRRTRCTEVVCCSCEEFPCETSVRDGFRVQGKFNQVEQQFTLLLIMTKTVVITDVIDTWSVCTEMLYLVSVFVKRTSLVLLISVECWYQARTT